MTNLPDRWWHEGWAALPDGGLVLLGSFPDGDGYTRALAWATPDELTLQPAPHLEAEAFATHEPFLLGAPAGGCAVLTDPQTAWLHDAPGAPPREVRLDGAEVFATIDPPPRVLGGCAVTTDGGTSPTWAVVLSHGVLTQEKRHAANLTIDVAAGTGAWSGPMRTLRPDDFPRDPFGDDAFGEVGEPAVSLTATLRHDDDLLVMSEGSDLGSMNRYGSDFASVAAIGPDDAVTGRVWERSGWKREPGKHGVHGRFTSDGRHVLLTPSFRTGEWKGRQRVLRLQDGSLLAPALPKGWTGARLLDGHGTTWWLDREGELRAMADLELDAV